jgi:hypothetical protein
MLMIIIGGFMYMTAAGNTSKAGTAKTVITDAIYGLIVALSAYLLLFIINPDLVGVDISMSPMTTRPSPPTPAPPSPSPTPPGPTPSGSGCSRVISSAQTMMARGCLYDQSRRNGCTGNPGYTDCSDLVDTSYRQAGCSSPGNNSATIGSHGQPIGDSNSLRTGDVLAVPGHVVMCVSDGCRTVIGASGVGRDIRYSNGSYYINQGATVVRASNYCSSC